MPSDPSSHDAASPHFHPVLFHPEFGYLVPRLALRTKARLVVKTTVVGGIIGALAVVALVPSRDPAPVVQSAHATPGSVQASRIAAKDRWHMTPPKVLYVAPTLAMPAATAVPPRLGAAASLKGEAAPRELATEAAPGARPQPSIAAAPVAKPAKKVARQPKRERDARPAPAEPDPRSAYAGSVRRFAEPRREWQDRRGFWNW